MAGRKVFTSGEILTAADVNSYLMDQSVMVFADSSARSSAIPTPTEGMVTYREDANRVEVYDGSAFGPIGGILQVVSTTKTDTFTTTSSTFGDITGLTASITPSTTSSKILILAQVSVSLSDNSGFGHFRLSGGNATDYVGDAAGSRVRSVFGGQSVSNDFISLLGLNMNYLDSPSTTSEVTYSVQTRQAELGTVYINRAQSDTDNTGRARGASTITLLEVAV